MMVKVRVSDIQSSNINAMDFIWRSEEGVWSDDVVGHLRVEFQSGPRYIYENVPHSVMMQIASSESAGSAFNSLILKSNYKFYKEG